MQNNETTQLIEKTLTAMIKNMINLPENEFWRFKAWTESMEKDFERDNQGLRHAAKIQLITMLEVLIKLVNEGCTGQKPRIKEMGSEIHRLIKNFESKEKQ